MKIYSRKLNVGASVVALMGAASFFSAAVAQDNNTGTAETVVVTGTNIRNVPPVGSNVMAITSADIQATGAADMQGVLAQNPALMNFGTGAQGQGTGANSGVVQPSIHGLGNSSSSTTLVVVDGHRFATGGTNHEEPDPNIIPFNMVARVDVLAEGASSIYGSDAIAGVVNIVTRRAFSGIQLDATATYYPEKTDWQAGILAGYTYDKGWTEVSFTQEHQSMLLNVDRPWTSPTAVVARGGVNPASFSCSPATIQPTGSLTIFTNATSGVQLANTIPNGFCSAWQYGAITPNNDRTNMMIKWHHDLGSQLTLDTELNAFSRIDSSIASRGAITATVFGTGAQANPFFLSPVGFSPAATKETIKWDANDLIGPGAVTGNTDINVFGDAKLEYRPDDNWAIDITGLMGRDDTVGTSKGTLNSAAASLALNGTITTGGSTTTAVPNSTVVFTQLPLTTSNALDVWNPKATNRTSPAVLAAITDNFNQRDYTNSLEEFEISANGTLFNIPAGAVKVAIGAEMQNWDLLEQSNAGDGAGPAGAFSTFQSYHLPRTVRSAYAEAIIPIISPMFNIPLVQMLDIDISGRYDSYSDFGDTMNPKISFDLQVYDDLKLRGNYATSFVAPPLDDTGDVNGQTTLAVYGAAGGPGNVNLPVATFPTLVQMGIPGCTAASVTCNISSLTGLSVTTGDKNMQPDKGRTWSLGADFSPSFLPGFVASGTMWWAHLKGAPQVPSLSFLGNVPQLAFLLQLFPAPGATAAQIAAATKGVYGTAAIAPGINYIFDAKNTNILNVETEGVDFNIGYSYDTGSFGTFRIGDAGSILMNSHEAFGIGGVAPPGQAYSVTNTIGNNSTFTQIGNQQRFSLNWNMNPFQAAIFMNYTGSYHNVGSGALNPIIDNQFGFPVGGGDKVPAATVFSLHMGYSFETAYFGSDNISLSVSNLFNQKPPLVNGGVGGNASSLERGIALQLKANL